MSLPVYYTGNVPALPLLTNPDAEASYSLRKLTPSYSGSAVRIRRSSDDAEQDIGFNGLDFDIAGAESFCGAGDGFVTTWYDQSGNGNDVTQATAGNQPQIVSSGSVVTENGKPAVEFDGSNDLLDGGSILSLTTELSMFLLVKDIDDGTFDGIVTKYTNSSEGGYDYSIRNDSAGQVEAGLRGASAITGSTFPFTISGGHFISSWVGTTSSSKVYINDTLRIDETGTWTSGAQNGDFQIGARKDSLYFRGKIQELIIYDSDKSSARTVIEGDMNRYYGVF